MTTSDILSVLPETRMAQALRDEFYGPPAPSPLSGGGPAVEAGHKKAAEAQAAMTPALVAGELLIEIDREAGRFVNILKDADSDEIVRRYPDEQQLAYSRAVRAYEQALAEQFGADGPDRAD